MKKPEYLKIMFPAGQKDFSTAVKRYFKNLEGKECLLNFGELRRRKSFKYSIIQTEATKWSFNDETVPDEREYQIILTKI